MSRYYSSQPYARLDDPEWSADPSASAEHLDTSSYEPYRSFNRDDANTALNHQNEGLPSAYLETKYPAHGLKGLGKSKWYSSLGSWGEWSKKKKIVIISSIVAVVIIIAIIIAAAVSLSSGSDFSYTQSFAKVTNEDAFANGGAREDSPQNTNDGVGAGEDKYVYYSGDASNFPDSSEWISYQQMWTNNLPTIQGSCSTLGDGEDDTSEQIKYIADAVRNRSTVSLVDHRFILAIILQESQGCVHVGETTSTSGVTNPGLMQSHNGHSYDSSNSWESILQMVQDGTQGTSVSKGEEGGVGLVYGLNTYGNAYMAARYYNSGIIAKSGDLSETDSGTPCYVSDVANRLTGWTTAKNLCPDA